LTRADGKHPDGRPKQVVLTFHGTAKQANAWQVQLAHEANRGEFMAPNRLTLGDHLDAWLEKYVKPRLAPNTYESYRLAIKNHLKPALGHILAQKLKGSDIAHYYAQSKLARASMMVQHAILSSSLKTLVLDDVLRYNPTERVTNKPTARHHEDVPHNVLCEHETLSLMSAVATHGTTQDVALFALALDSGARKAELLGLKWSDLTDRNLRIERQLMRGDRDAPTFAQPKRKAVRTSPSLIERSSCC
jgi:integrase